MSRWISWCRYMGLYGLKIFVYNFNACHRVLNTMKLRLKKTIDYCQNKALTKITIIIKWFHWCFKNVSNNMTATFCKVQCCWKFLKTTAEEGIFRVIAWIALKYEIMKGEFHVKMAKKVRIFLEESHFLIISPYADFGPIIRKRSKILTFPPN